MDPILQLEWPIDEGDMDRVQAEMAALVRVRRLSRTPAVVAGLAVAAPTTPGQAWAAVVVLRAGQTEPPMVATAQAPAPAGYSPGRLAFAAGPAAAAALRAIRARPDLLLVAGHGVAHPARCGLASHLGVVFDLPTVGCADRPLIGRAAQLAPQRGDWQPLLAEGQTVGALLRTRRHVRPLCVSPGHRVDVLDAVREVLVWCRYRWPDPLRLARAALRGPLP